MINPFKRKPKPVPAKRNYAFAQSGKTTHDFFSQSLTADQAVYQSLSAMRNRARTLERDNSLVRKFLLMAKTNIIGAKGIRLQSQAGQYQGGKFIPDRNDQNIIETAYEEFSKAWNFSADMRQNRRRFAQIGLQRILVDGEFIFQIIRGADNLHGISLHMIDAERLDHTLNREAKNGGNEIRMGVEIDALSRPVAYHFLKDAPPQWSGVATAGGHRERIPAEQIRHIYIQERPGQTRGITWLAPTGLRAKMLDGIETAVTVGFRVAASKMGFFTADENYEGEALDENDIPTDVAPGMLDMLPKGINFSSFDPGYPNADFDPFKKSIVREIAAGLGVSYPEMGNDFQGVSYSAGQIGVHSDAALWADLQQFWVEEFEEPIFREWLIMAMTTGALNLPLGKLWKFQKAKFQPPRRKHIDPLKTHNAQRVALGDMSRDPYDIAAENGADFDDIVEQTVRAVELLKANGLPIPDSWGAGNMLSEIQEESPAA